MTKDGAGFAFESFGASSFSLFLNRLSTLEDVGWEGTEIVFKELTVLTLTDQFWPTLFTV